MPSHSRLAAVIAPLVLSLAACGQSGTTAGSGGASSGAAGGPAGSGGGATTQGNGGAGGGTPAASSTGVGGTMSSSAGGSGGGPATLFPAGTICNDSGQVRNAPATVKHVVVILFENKDFGSVNNNANAPYMNSIVKDCGYAKNFLDNCFTTDEVSLPHYLALTSGSNCNTGLDKTGTGCVTDDSDPASHKLSTTSIFDQVSSWKSYQESMPSTCDRTSSYPYGCKHNPAVYYTAISNADCSANDVPIAAVTCDAMAKMTPCTTPSNAFATDIMNDSLPAYAFVTPNLENDMHDGSVTQGDNWLLTYLPLILNSRSYLNGEIVVFVLWDEQGGFNSGTTPNFFVSPYITKGTASPTQVNLFAALRASENALGISTYLGCASGTKPGGGMCPAGSTADLRGAIGF